MILKRDQLNDIPAAPSLILVAFQNIWSAPRHLLVIMKIKVSIYQQFFTFPSHISYKTRQIKKKKKGNLILKYMSFLKCLSPGIFRGCYVVCNYIS